MKNFLLLLILLFFCYNSHGAHNDTIAKWNPNYFFKTRTAFPVVPFPPSELASTYNPSGFSKGDTTWLYCKADNTNQVFSFYSTDEGQSFTFADTAVAYSLTDAAWHRKLTSDPAVLADSAAGIVHCLFKGESGGAGDSISIGYGSVSFSNPRRFTIQNSDNAVLTPTYLKSVIGNNNIRDVTPGDIIKKDDLYYIFIGVEDIVAGNYKLYLFTTANFLSYNYIGKALDASAPFDVAYKPAIFKVDNIYYMQITHQKYNAGIANGLILCKWSKDLIKWNDLPGRFLETSNDTGRWDFARVYTGTIIRKPDGYNLTPTLYGDHWNFYFSGSTQTIAGTRRDRCGLAKIYPFQYGKDTFSSDQNMNIKEYRNAATQFNASITVPDGVFSTFTGFNNYNIVVRMTSVPNVLAEATPASVASMIDFSNPYIKNQSTLQSSSNFCLSGDGQAANFKAYGDGTIPTLQLLRKKIPISAADDIGYIEARGRTIAGDNISLGRISFTKIADSTVRDTKLSFALGNAGALPTQLELDKTALYLYNRFIYTNPPKGSISDSIFVFSGDTVKIAAPVQSLLDAKQNAISATNGSVLFYNNGVSHHNSNFFWDPSNIRLGLKTNSPSYLLHINETSSSAIQRSAHIMLNAGHTGSGRTDAIVVINQSAGTGADFNTPAANTGGTFSAIATTAGYNIGGRFVGSNSTVLNVGYLGDATVSSSGMNMGAYSRALNGTTNVGFMTTLTAGTGTGTISASSAFIADNGTTTSNIATFQDNGNAVIQFKDGGTITHSSGLAAWSGSGSIDLLGRNQSSLNYERLTLITGSTTLDFPSTAAGTSAELTITVTGAADGDPVIPGTPNVSVNANSCFTYRVSAPNTVTVQFNNYSSSAINPASGTFKATIIK